MDKELTERLAREAGFKTTRAGVTVDKDATHADAMRAVIELVALVAEECAKIAESFVKRYDDNDPEDDAADWAFERAAAAIRAKFVFTQEK